MAVVARTWEEQEIKELILTSDDMVKASVKKLYTYQTKSEQEHKDTHELNKVGFNAYDAPFLSSVAEFYIKNGFLSSKQIMYTRKKLIKYIGQLTKIANGEI